MSRTDRLKQYDRIDRIRSLLPASFELEDETTEPPAVYDFDTLIEHGVRAQRKLEETTDYERRSYHNAEHARTVAGRTADLVVHNDLDQPTGCALVLAAGFHDYGLGGSDVLKDEEFSALAARDYADQLGMNHEQQSIVLESILSTEFALGASDAMRPGSSAARILAASDLGNVTQSNAEWLETTDRVLQEEGDGDIDSIEWIEQQHNFLEYVGGRFDCPEVPGGWSRSVAEKKDLVQRIDRFLHDHQDTLHADERAAFEPLMNQIERTDQTIQHDSSVVNPTL